MDASSSRVVVPPSSDPPTSRPKGNRGGKAKERFLTRDSGVSGVTSETRAPPATSASVVSSMLSLDHDGGAHSELRIASQEICVGNAGEADDAIFEGEACESNASNHSDAGAVSPDGRQDSDLGGDASKSQREEIIMTSSRGRFRDCDLEDAPTIVKLDHSAYLREILESEGLAGDFEVDGDEGEEDDEDINEDINFELEAVREEMLRTTLLTVREHPAAIAIALSGTWSVPGSDQWPSRSFEEDDTSGSTGLTTTGLSFSLGSAGERRRIPVVPAVMADGNGSGRLGHLGGGERTSLPSAVDLGEAEPMVGNAALALRRR